MIKLFIKLVVALIVLLIIGVVAVYLSLDSIVKKTVEVEGTQQLHVTTSLDSVSLGLTKGTVDLKGFALGSPAGFTAPRMMSVGELNVNSGGLSNLRSKPVHIISIDIENPVLVVEQQGEKLNFKAMMDSLPSSPDTKSAPASQSEPTKYVIDSLAVNGSDVQMDVGIASLKKHFDVKLPSFSMKNLGNEDGKMQGVAIKDVVTAVLTQMVDNATKSAGIPVDVKSLMSGNLAGVQDKLTGAARQKLSSFIPPQAGNALNGLLGKPAAGGQPADPAKALQDRGKGLLKGLGQ
jgi:hypothetical protein